MDGAVGRMASALLRGARPGGFVYDPPGSAFKDILQDIGLVLSKKSPSALERRLVSWSRSTRAPWHERWQLAGSKDEHADADQPRLPSPRLYACTRTRRTHSGTREFCHRLRLARGAWIRLNAHRWCQQLERATVPAHADRAMECAWSTRAELLEPCEDEP